MPKVLSSSHHLSSGLKLDRYSSRMRRINLIYQPNDVRAENYNSATKNTQRDLWCSFLVNFKEINRSETLLSAPVSRSYYPLKCAILHRSVGMTGAYRNQAKDVYVNGERLLVHCMCR